MRTRTSALPGEANPRWADRPPSAGPWRHSSTRGIMASSPSPFAPPCNPSAPSKPTTSPPFCWARSSRSSSPHRFAAPTTPEARPEEPGKQHPDRFPTRIRGRPIARPDQNTKPSALAPRRLSGAARRLIFSLRDRAPRARASCAAGPGLRRARWPAGLRRPCAGCPDPAGGRETRRPRRAAPADLSYGGPAAV